MANDLPNQPFIYEGVEPISGKENEGGTVTEKITRAAQDAGMHMTKRANLECPSVF